MNPPGINPVLTSMEGCQIQIAGSMNAAIHHPAWYRLVGLISEHEYESAINGRPASGPISSSFLFRAGEIQCQPQAWTVSTAQLEDLSPIVTMAAKLFDDLLPHTPIQAYSIGFFFHAGVQTGIDPRRGLLTAISNANIGLAGPPDGTAHFSHNFGNEAQETSVLIEPSNRDRQRIFLNFKTTFTIQPGTDHAGRVKFDQFNIGPLLANHATATQSAARQQLQRTLDAIKCLQE